MDLNGIERFSCTSKLYESMETDGCSQYFNEGRRPIVCNFQEHAQNGLSIGGTLVSRCPTTIEETFFKKISTVDVCLSTKEIVVRFILVKKKLFCFFFFFILLYKQTQRGFIRGYIQVCAKCYTEKNFKSDNSSYVKQ